MSPTRAQISVALDNTAGDALDVLIADGSSIGDAVRAAIVSAAHMHQARDLHGPNHPWDRDARRAGLRHQLETVPPISSHQTDVLTEALVAQHVSTSAQTTSQRAATPRDDAATRAIYERLERMDAAAATSATRKGGRPAKYLLSRIAVCAACDAPLRVGTQNAGKPHAHDQPSEPSRYRVYECPGLPGQRGFHVSMRQEHLDQLVTEAVLERVAQQGFQIPSRLDDEEARAEHQALRAEISGHWAWLTSVREESARRGWQSDLLTPQQDIVLPKIRAAERRMIELERRDPLVTELYRSFPVAGGVWKRMPIAQQRQVVQALVVPRIHPVDPSDRGLQGVNERRVELVWR